MKDDVLIVHGTVIEGHRGDLFSCDVEIGGVTTRVLAKRSGRLYSRSIRILPGDRVEVELSPYDTSRGRIVYRGDRREAS